MQTAVGSHGHKGRGGPACSNVCEIGASVVYACGGMHADFGKLFPERKLCN